MKFRDMELQNLIETKEAIAKVKAETAPASSVEQEMAEIDKEAEATNTTTDDVEWVEDDDGNFVKKGK